MLKNLLPTSEVINDQAPALSAPQSYVRRMTYQRWLRAARYFAASRSFGYIIVLDGYVINHSFYLFNRHRHIPSRKVIERC